MLGLYAHVACPCGLYLECDGHILQGICMCVSIMCTVLLVEWLMSVISCVMYIHVYMHVRFLAYMPNNYIDMITLIQHNSVMLV